MSRSLRHQPGRWTKTKYRILHGRKIAIIETVVPRHGRPHCVTDGFRFLKMYCIRNRYTGRFTEVIHSASATA